MSDTLERLKAEADEARADLDTWLGAAATIPGEYEEQMAALDRLCRAHEARMNERCAQCVEGQHTNGGDPSYDEELRAIAESIRALRAPVKSRVK